jgi:hypothetical protein
MSTNLREILEELVEDVKLAYGGLGPTDEQTGELLPDPTGNEWADAIDEKALDWPDLAVTYHKAVEALAADCSGEGRDDLLAACRELSGWMREHCSVHDGCTDMLVRACAAIAKVEAQP